MTNFKTNRFFGHLVKASKKIEDSKSSIEDIEKHIKKVKEFSNINEKLKSEVDNLQESVMRAMGKKDLKNISSQERLKEEKLKDKIDILQDKLDKTTEEKDVRINQLQDRLGIYSKKFKEKPKPDEIRRKVELMEKKYMRIKKSRKYSDEELHVIKHRIDITKQKLDELEGVKSEEKIVETNPYMTNVIPNPRNVIIKPEEPWIKPQLRAPPMPPVVHAPELNHPLPFIDNKDQMLPPEKEEKKGFFSMFKKKKD